MDIEEFKRKALVMIIGNVMNGDETQELERSQFIQDAISAGFMSHIEADAWFTQTLNDSIEGNAALKKLKNSNLSGKTSTPPDPRERRLMWSSVITSLVVCTIIFLLVIRLPGAMGKGGIDLVGFALLILGTLFYPLMLGARWVFKQVLEVNDLQKNLKKMDEYKHWIWLCQRCQATYAYQGEEYATCGRCGNTLTRVRGMAVENPFQ